MASILAAVRVFYSVAYRTLSAVTILHSATWGTLSAVTMLAQIAEVLCRPREYFRRCRWYSVGRWSIPSCCIRYSVGRESTISHSIKYSVGRHDTCAKWGSILSAVRVFSQIILKTMYFEAIYIDKRRVQQQLWQRRLFPKRNKPWESVNYKLNSYDNDTRFLHKKNFSNIILTYFGF